MERILKNQILCLLCDDLIVSKYRHDFVTCSCGAVSCYGGNDFYRRRLGESYNYIDMSIIDNGKHSLRRENVMWGINYDENQ